MSNALSGISPDNINLGPSSFVYQVSGVGDKRPEFNPGVGFNQELDLKVNNLKSSVSEPLGSTGTGNAIKDFVLSVNEKDKVAESMRTAVLSGESNNLHQTMIASQEANISFTLMLEMRNKVMETYQELMRLQI